MVTASSTNAVYYDLEAENFINPEEVKPKESEGFFSKIKRLLFY